MGRLVRTYDAAKPGWLLPELSGSRSIAGGIGLGLGLALGLGLGLGLSLGLSLGLVLGLVLGDGVGVAPTDVKPLKVVDGDVWPTFPIRAMTVLPLPALAVT